MIIYLYLDNEKIRLYSYNSVWTLQSSGAFRNVHFATNCKLQPLRNESCCVRAELQPFGNCHNCKKKFARNYYNRNVM